MLNVRWPGVPRFRGDGMRHCATALLATAALALSAPEARADCIVAVLDTVFPFEGEVVPANAELRVLYPQLTAVNLTYPDSSVVTVPIVLDDIGSLLDLPAPLPAGTFSLEYFDRAIAFQVSPDMDDQPPAAPLVSVSRRTEGSGVSLPFVECPTSGVRDFVIFEVEGAGAGDRLLLIDGSFVAVTNPDGVTEYSQRDDDGGSVTYDVQLRDLAGNQSDATTVEVWMGCQGGCASAGSLTPLGFSLVALAFRRRKAAQEVRLGSTVRGTSGQRTKHSR